MTNSSGTNLDSACAGPEGPSLMDETSNPREDAIRHPSVSGGR